MKITLKDGSFKEYQEPKSVYEIALDISEGLARVATEGEVDGEAVDLRTVIDHDCEPVSYTHLDVSKRQLSKRRSFVYGALSGVVEPIAALLTILLTGLVVPLLPYLLSFAAGAMIYVVVEELIPEAQTGPHSNISTVGVAVGFVIMMILDVALG